MGAKVSKQKPPKKMKANTVHVEKQKVSKEGKESIKDLLYNATDMPLAKPGTDHLPNIVRAAGFKAIEELASIALSTFKNSGRGVKLRGAETERLQNVVGLSKAVVDSLEWDEFCDVAAFVAEVVRCIKLNTILVGAAAVWYESQRKSDHTIQLSTEKREELRLSVFWCFLMHAVVKRTVFQPCSEENCILEELMTGFSNKRKEDEEKWVKNIDAFSKMKGLHTHTWSYTSLHTHALTHQPENLVVTPIHVLTSVGSRYNLNSDFGREKETYDRLKIGKLTHALPPTTMHA